MRPVKPVVQESRRRGVNQPNSDEGQKLSRTDIGVIAGSAALSLAGLILIAWLLLPISGVIVPFVVASALPLFTLLAIIYQAVVYRRQWNVMQQALTQTDRVIGKIISGALPRLRIR